eukprot:Nitzschia sp. Nitz4//scaffold36_size144017//39191//40152//NITZ4_003075-RA/size144017-snap-gene-0.189-mRNA-1//1//CDS//3329549423//8315//frame0
MPNEHRPSWMDAENDDSHKAEIAPLFGTGNLNLADDFDEEEGEDGFTTPEGYGATEGSDALESLDADQEHQTVSTFSSADSKPSKPTKLVPKDKEKARRAQRISFTASGKPEQPRLSWLMKSFHAFETLGVIICLTLLVSQLAPLIMIPLKELGWTNVFEKIYLALFCFIFALVEADAPIGFLRGNKFLQNFISRGFLYSFIGLSALDEAYEERITDMIAHAREQFHVSWYSFFLQFAAWLMLVLGVLYMCLGVCCLNLLRDRVKRQRREDLQSYHEAMQDYNRGTPWTSGV